MMGSDAIIDVFNANQNGWCGHNGTGIAIPGLVQTTKLASKAFMHTLLQANYCLHHHFLHVMMKDTCRAQLSEVLKQSRLRIPQDNPCSRKSDFVYTILT